MEAALTHRSSTSELPSDKAARIVEAMRACVAGSGFSGATFDNVARQAGVSRGLLHYYFSTKELLLAEVVRRECQVRLELLNQAIATAGGADDLIDALVRSFEELMGEGSSDVVMFYELLTLAQRNDGIAAELAELARSLRLQLAQALQAGSEAGVFELRAPADDVATFLLALADGVMVRRMSEPELDVRRLMDLAVAAARALLA